MFIFALGLFSTLWNSFFMLFINFAFLLWSLRSLTLLQNRFVSLVPCWWTVFAFSPLLADIIFFRYFFKVLFCLYCLFQSRYFFSLPSFTFWFISSSCIFYYCYVAFSALYQHLIFFFCLIFACSHRFLICVSNIISHSGLAIFSCPLGDPYHYYYYYCLLLESFSYQR